MPAMNRINILVISTRDIGKKETIFEHAKRMGGTSMALKNYFIEKENGKDELDKLVQLDVDKSGEPSTSYGNPNALVNFALEVFKANKEKLEKNGEAKIISDYCKKIKEGEDLNDNYSKLANLLKTLPDAFKLMIKDFDKRYEMANTYKPGRKNFFELKDFEDENYLAKPAINTDNRPLENNRNQDGSDKPLTLRDRISLFSVCDDIIEEGKTGNNYIYAVLTLKKEDDDTKENKWVDSLTYAVIEELDLKDDININLIIMLHDKDLKSTSSETFKTVRSQEALKIKVENDGKRTFEYDTQRDGHLKRTLIVFNHPNHFYRNLIIQKEGEEKTATKIIKDIEKGTVFSLNEQHLKDVSQQIATLSNSDSLSSVAEKYKEITIDDADYFVRYKELEGLLNSGSADGPTLIRINDKINEFIRYYSSLIYGTNDIY